MTKIIWLMLHVTSFTPDSQITVRELLIPFNSVQDCETARAGILYTTNSIGVAVDSGACVSVGFTDSEFKSLTAPWPDQRPLDEKLKAEKRRQP